MNVIEKTSKIYKRKKILIRIFRSLFFGRLHRLKRCPLCDRFQFPLVMLLFSCYEKC